MSGRPDRLEAALRLIELGYRVTPFYIVDGGKVPVRKQLWRAPCADHPLNRNSEFTAEEIVACRACKGGVRAATSNPRYLTWVWKKVGRDALIGVVPPTGAVALDDDSFVFSSWDGVPCVRSQSGKAHYWYRLAEGQELWSENGILFTEPDGKIDVRTCDGSLFIGIPAGSGPYEAINGWSPDPATWPVLDDETYQRLRSAPRAGVAGGIRGAGGKYRPGLPQVPVGGSYDKVDDVVEQLLEDEGWAHDTGDYWTRPGKEGGTSGSVLQIDGVTWLICFTSSAEPLAPGAYYTASSLRCALLDGGDWDITRAALATEGYGDTGWATAEEEFDDVVCDDCDMLGTLCSAHAPKEGPKTAKKTCGASGGIAKSGGPCGGKRNLDPDGRCEHHPVGSEEGKVVASGEIDVSNPAEAAQWLRGEIGRGALSCVHLRGGRPVVVPRIGEDGYVKPKDPKADDGPAQIWPLDIAGLRTRVEIGYSLVQRNAEGVYVKAMFPFEAARQTIEAAKGDLGTRSLKSFNTVTHTPLLRPDGTILDTPGHDESTRVLYLPDPGLNGSGVSSGPVTAKAVQQAKSVLLKPYAEFQWKRGTASLSNLLGALMIPTLRLIVGGPYPMFAIDAPDRGSGKALDVDEVVPTPTGWSRMGDLKAGDEVFDENGDVCRVMAVSEVWEDRECYEVYGRGVSIVADAAHEWLCRRGRREPDPVHGWGGKWVIRTTRELDQVRSERSTRASLPPTPVLNLPEVDLPLDPYVFGCWLGDGGSGTAQLTQGASDMEHFRLEFKHAGMVVGDTVWKNDRAGFFRFSTQEIVKGGSPRDSAQRRLRDMGVLGDKHIPAVYLRASAAQRLSLLQGLVDTDGHVLPNGSIEIAQGPKGERLLRQIAELVHSLGAVTAVRSSSKTYKGEPYTVWSIGFRLPNAARLPRKLARIRETADGREVRVHRVRTRRVERRATVCIEVDSPSHLFLAGRAMVPTHNSYVAAGLRMTHGGVLVPSWPTTEEEVSKAIGARLRTTTAPVITFDNVRGVLRSAELEALATSSEINFRVLGESRVETYPNDRLWTITGNNLVIGGDLDRRIMRISIDTGVENPHLRTGPKEGKTWAVHPVRYFIEHRSAVLSAILTLGKAWMEAGSPGAAASRSDDYADLTTVVGGILEWAELGEGFGDQTGANALVSEDLEDWGDWLSALAESFGIGTGFTTRQVMNALSDVGGLDMELLPGTLASKYRGGNNEAEFLQALGSWFRFKQGTRSGGLRVVVASAAKRSGKDRLARWAVVGA